MEPETWPLDALSPRSALVGYGELGRNGLLGYEDKRVTAGGRIWESALSAHPPSCLVFDLDGGFTSFHCQVAINEDVPAGISQADFFVLADSRPVAVASHVMAGEPPRALAADVAGARRLELRVDTSRWDYCHAVWLEPRLEKNARARPGVLIDCLGRTEILLPEVPPRAGRCIATVVSPGFEALLENMLGSLRANGGCPDALIVLFAVGESAEIDRIAAKHGAFVVHCRKKAHINCAVKSVLYSAARVVEAGQLLCLDADMLVLKDLSPLFACLDVCQEKALLVCREGNGVSVRNLGEALCQWYGGELSDVRRLLGEDGGEGGYPLVVNDGLMAGRRSALLALDACIRRMSQASVWLDGRPDIGWRNQWIFNLALAHLSCGVELDPVYNVQLLSQDVETTVDGKSVRAWWHGREVSVLHFNGGGRHKYGAFRDLFSREQTS